MVHQIVRDWRDAALSASDRVLCEFAARLTHAPASMDEPALQPLRDQGLDDRAIHDAVQVIGYFNYITRVAESLGVEAEEFIRPWGSEAPRPGAYDAGSSPGSGGGQAP